MQFIFKQSAKFDEMIDNEMAFDEINATKLSSTKMIGNRSITDRNMNKFWNAANETGNSIENRLRLKGDRGREANINRIPIGLYDVSCVWQLQCRYYLNYGNCLYNYLIPRCNLGITPK